MQLNAFCYPIIFVTGLSITASCAHLNPAQEQSLEGRRFTMVQQQIAERGIRNKAVLKAMETVPRHLFVPEGRVSEAYADRPVPIGFGQTISQPYIVALMTELAEVQPDDTVLEIGTGSGYQAAILSVLAKRVFTIEYIEGLGLQARTRLAELGYENVQVKIGDGYQGWPEHQPFDSILITAAIDHVPQPLIDQLKTGGRIVVPLGRENEVQTLGVIVKRSDGKLDQKEIIPVRFVPFLGEKGKSP
ncbi:MAG: protein-L-isoaspartate(D-aspartate) O-methyltransferase [Acidobacteriota bacterium]